MGNKHNRSNNPGDDSLKRDTERTAVDSTESQPQNEDSTDSADVTLSRRSYLTAAGAATTGLAGYAEPVRATTVYPVSTFGYGQTDVVQHSLSLSGLDAGSNNSKQTARSLAFDETVSGKLPVNGSTWYSIELSRGDGITVEFTRSAIEGLTVIVLYDPVGELSTLKHVTDSSAALLGLTAQTEGTQYIQILEIQDSSGEYTLTVTEGNESDDTEDDYGLQGYGSYGYGSISA